MIKRDPSLKNGKNFEFTLQKEDIEWPTSTRKDARHH